VSLDTHANAIHTEKWVLFLRVFAFLSSRRVVIVHHPACTSPPKPKYTQKKAEVSKTNSFVFLEKKSDAFRFSTSHSWKDTQTPAQSVW
jgi:uncharacterized protein (UPF0276 family)